MRLKILLVLLLVLLPLRSNAASLAERLAGRFILNVERDMSLWYVNPADLRKYPVPSAGALNFLTFRVGQDIDEPTFNDLAEYSSAKTSATSTLAKYQGRILRFNGLPWYVNPTDGKKYFFGNGLETYQAVKKIALGVSYRDFLRLHKPGMDESLNEWSGYREIEVAVDNKKYQVATLRISLDNPKLKIITDTAEDGDCPKKCQAKPLADYALAHKAFAAVNGSYFDTSAAKKNYYFFPVYNSRLSKMINRGQLKYWTTGPLFAFDIDNNFYYFRDSREFAAATSFQPDGSALIKRGLLWRPLVAAIGNKPRLIQEKLNYLIEWDLDNYQKTHRSLMNALVYVAKPGSKGDLMIVAVRNATLPELGNVLLAMNVDYALNLDGGSSTAIFYNEEYLLGPGRDIPNAIMFAER